MSNLHKRNTTMLAWLSFLLPPLGLIIYLTGKSKSEKKFVDYDVDFIGMAAFLGAIVWFGIIYIKGV